MHVECRGLEPGREYWYRFIAGGEASPIGHLRTAPPPGAPLDRLRFGFVSCANYELGYFSAYRHLAAENPDLVLFLGDYIYEYVSNRPGKVREHSDGVEATDLRTYRNRYAQYRTDPDLQALHEAAPCLAIWDDHEVQNDYADDRSQNFDDPLVFLKRRAAAYQAFWEHMPLPPWARPRGPDMTIFCRHDFGALATFLLVDGRQYRSRLACDRPPRGGGKQMTDAACPERLDPRRSYLGKAQEAWLYREFGNSAARWNFSRQGQLMAEFKERLDNGEISHWSEDWNGYPAARNAAPGADRRDPAGQPGRARRRHPFLLGERAETRFRRSGRAGHRLGVRRHLGDLERAALREISPPGPPTTLQCASSTAASAAMSAPNCARSGWKSRSAPSAMCATRRPAFRHCSALSSRTDGRDRNRPDAATAPPSRILARRGAR